LWSTLDLEVEVQTEGQVVTIEVQTELAGVVVVTIGVELIPTEETDVRNKAYSSFCRVFLSGR